MAETAAPKAGKVEAPPWEKQVARQKHLRELLGQIDSANVFAERVETAILENSEGALQELEQEARQEAEKARQAASTRAAGAWREWARATVEDGGTAAHKFAEDKAQWEDPILDGLPVVGNQAVAAVLGVWAQH